MEFCPNCWRTHGRGMCLNDRFGLMFASPLEDPLANIIDKLSRLNENEKKKDSKDNFIRWSHHLQLFLNELKPLPVSEQLRALSHLTANLKVMHEGKETEKPFIEINKAVNQFRRETEVVLLECCEQCHEPGWDGYICHSCGLKKI